MERSIVHCDLDTHFVSVERLQNSKLIELPVLILPFSCGWQLVFHKKHKESASYGCVSWLPSSE